MAAERSVFVARERELARLHDFLDLALAGQGQVVFVTGEAGSGKTALVTEFARRAQDDHPDLLVALGNCNAQTGIGDPYLPFREVLGLLTGDVEAKLAQGAITQENADRLRDFLRVSGQALVELGPELIGIFVPGGGLATRAAAFLAGKVGWLDKLEKITERGAAGPGDLEQSHIFEQYTNVLRALAAQRPLVLALDDLQWADAASISLLFHLGRRIGESRILIVGAYRPDEVALGRAGERHPLEKVLAEFKRYFGDIWVDLDQVVEAEGREFVEAFLGTQASRLDEDFRQALFRRTRGHPLFTIELLRDMRERGDLMRDEQGCWVEGPALDWRALPARVEGVIEERIGRLEEELRELLTLAAVEGEHFTVQVLARAQEVEERRIVRHLVDELDRRHCLVAEEGAESLNGRRIYRYRFRHVLFQQYLYSCLSPVQRELLHGDIGQALEELYQGRTDEVAVHLARHYTAAGQTDKAVDYLLDAGDRARRLYAPQEAIDYYQQALALLPEGADTRGVARRLKLYEGLGEMLQRQARYAEAMEAYAAMRAAAEAAGDGAAQARAWLGWSTVQDRQGDHQAALESAGRAEEVARATHARGELATALLIKGWAFYRLGNAKAALALGEQALALSTELDARREMARSLNLLGLTHDIVGHYDQAVHYKEKALALFRELGDRRWVGTMLGNLGNTAHFRGDYHAAVAHYQDALTIVREVGDRDMEMLYLSNLGATRVRLGEYHAAEADLRQVIRLTETTGWVTLSLAYYFLAEACLGQERVEDAQAAAQQALQLAQETEQQESIGAAWRALGMVAARLPAPVTIGEGCYDAAACFAQSLQAFTEIGAEAERARTLREWARYEMDKGDRELGEMMWQEAREIFSRLGMELRAR